MASRCSHTGMGAEPGSVCGQKGTMKDVFARCLKRADFQVCTLIVYMLFYNAYLSLTTYVPFFTINNHVPLHGQVFCDCIRTGVYFLQVKINHESHEFLLDSGTVAYSYIRLNQVHLRTLMFQQHLHILLQQHPHTLRHQKHPHFLLYEQHLLTLKAASPSHTLALAAPSTHCCTRSTITHC